MFIYATITFLQREKSAIVITRISSPDIFVTQETELDRRQDIEKMFHFFSGQIQVNCYHFLAQEKWSVVVDERIHKFFQLRYLTSTLVMMKTYTDGQFIEACDRGTVIGKKTLRISLSD